MGCSVVLGRSIEQARDTIYVVRNLYTSATSSGNRQSKFEILKGNENEFRYIILTFSRE